MRKSAYTVLNIIFLFFIFFLCGGIFWLWKGRVSLLLERTPVVPPAVSFADIQKETPPPVEAAPSPSPTSTVSPEIPEVKSLPEEFNLAVPFTSQAPEKNWEQPWQDACEEAAVIMMDAYYKKASLSIAFSKDEILKMVKWEEEEHSWGRSIEIEKIQSIFNDYLGYTKSGKKVTLIENPTVDDIKHFIANGQPVYVVVDGKILPNPHFQNGGPEYHALVVKGYTKNTFITNDPGTQFGENFQYKYDDLMKSIRDWNGGNVKEGRRVILVIEN